MIENDDGGITEWIGGLGWHITWADLARRDDAEMARKRINGARDDAWARH
jgi:hypothetical protein